MHSSLRILQITLIITQITTVKGSSSGTLSTSAVNASTTVSSNGTLLTSAVNAGTTVASSVPAIEAPNTPASPNISVTASPLETARTSIDYNSSKQTVAPTTSVKAGQNTSSSSLESRITPWPLETPKMSTDYYSSAMQTGLPTINVPVASSTEQLTEASDVSNSFNVMTGVPSATPSRSWPSTSLEGSVSENATNTGSLTISVPNTSSTDLTANTNNTVSVAASTKATALSPSGPLTGQTQSITANYSLSSVSLRDSNSAEPKQTLTTSLPAVSVCVNWTDWSVDSSNCQKYCSEKGGTVTASRQCNSYTRTDNVYTKHDNSTKVARCSVECPISGKEAFGSSISTLAVSILLVMLSTFVWD